MAWVLGFMVFAIFGYIYHWWSSDAQSDIQGFISLGFVARVSRSVWATRLEPVPKADSLPSIDVVSYLNIPIKNEFFTLCKNKEGFDFQAAHYDFWFELRFLANDNYLYKAQIQAIQFENSPLQFLKTWQYQKIRQTKPRIIIKKPEIITQHLERIFKVIPELRKSRCVGFTEQRDSKTRQTLAVLVADIDELGIVKKLYLLRAKKLEQTWTPQEIAISMQRTSTRLGLGTVTSINWETENQIRTNPETCTREKPYLGYQMYPERFIADVPSIGVTANRKRFDVLLGYGKNPPKLNVLSTQEPQVRSYEFLPTGNDVPWTQITTLETIKYTKTPLLPKQKSK